MCSRASSGSGSASSTSRTGTRRTSSIVVFTEISIWNTYSFLRIFEGRQGDDYLTYVSLLVGPFLLLLAVNALLQDEDRDGVVDRSEFASRMRPSFFLMGLFVALHLLPGYRDDDGELAIVRLPALALVWSIAFFRRDWLIYGLGVVWVVGLVRRIQLGL